jgi:acylphosphatase
MTDNTNSRLHAIVTGHVQGVSFRYFVLEQADKLDLTGWVRNRWSGAVEVTAEGTRQNLEQLLLALREGPPMAVVSDLDFDWLAYSGEFPSFNMTETA